jgi:hypothetical protein
MVSPTTTTTTTRQHPMTTTKQQRVLGFIDIALSLVEEWLPGDDDEDSCNNTASEFEDTARSGTKEEEK